MIDYFNPETPVSKFFAHHFGTLQGMMDRDLVRLAHCASKKASTTPKENEN